VARQYRRDGPTDDFREMKEAGQLSRPLLTPCDLAASASIRAIYFAVAGVQHIDEGERVSRTLRAGRLLIFSSRLDPHFFGTHSLRRTKATLIYRRTGNLRAIS
jgi:hypothetical protein